MQGFRVVIKEFWSLEFWVRVRPAVAVGCYDWAPIDFHESA